MLHPDFARVRDDIVARAADVEGFLSGKEMRFLCLLGAVPTAAGTILEIGSFKGKSTVLLAKAARLAGDARVHSVDPLDAPSETDPDLRGASSSADAFRENLRRMGVEDSVTHHRMRSEELAPDWDGPIRLLWIDGDHTLRGARTDLECFLPHLADGAIVAMHDVLHAFEGGVRVFAEDVLLSDHFGAAGVVGSIAWAQYHRDPARTLRHRPDKLDLYRRMARLIPLVAFGRRPTGLARTAFKIARWRVPHGPIAPERFLEAVDLDLRPTAS
jgi:predicted O-methyltransferase YrrM